MFHGVVSPEYIDAQIKVPQLRETVEGAVLGIQVLSSQRCQTNYVNVVKQSIQISVGLSIWDELDGPAHAVLPIIGLSESL